MNTILRQPDRIQLLYGGFDCQRKIYLEDQTDVTVDFIPTDAGMKIDITGGDTPITFIKCRWYGKLPNDCKLLGDAIERAYGYLRYEGIRPERVMPWYFAVHTDTEQIGYGVKVRPDSFIFWQADPSGITLWLDLRCGTNGYALKGKTLTAAELIEYRESQGDAFSFLQNFCKKMADHPLTVDKPVYGFNNWYYAYGNISADSVMYDTVLLAELTKDYENRPFMVIDDGWENKSTVGCDCNEQFPDMPALVQSMKAKDIRPGIWIRPLLPKEKEHTALRNMTFSEFLDPSLDETLEVVAADMEKITREWGFELVKYDYVTYDIFHEFYFTQDIQMSHESFSLRNPMTNAQAIKRLYKTIYDHSNGAVLIGCNCVSHLGSGYFHIHRSGDDTSGKEWERTRFMGVNTLAFRLCQHKAFFEVDADCIGIAEDAQFSWELDSHWLEILADSNTPLFASIAASKVTGTVKEQLKEAFKKASKQDGSFIPLDLTKTSMPTHYFVDGVEKEYCFDDEMGAEQPLR